MVLHLEVFNLPGNKGSLVHTDEEVDSAAAVYLYEPSSSMNL